MMYRVQLSGEDDVEGWRREARALASHVIAPEQVEWATNEARGLFDGASVPQPLGSATLLVPKSFLTAAHNALLHSDPERFSLCYRLLLRLQNEPHLMQNAADRDVKRLNALAKAVARDKHKMTAFVRFREGQDDNGQPVFIAWFEPDHYIMRAIAPFFVKRFASMRFCILSPKGSFAWDGDALVHGGPADKAQSFDHDRCEDLWRLYYASIFNPARLKIKAMQSQMPKKYWHNLPEARIIKPLIESAEERTRAMIDTAPNPKRKRIKTALDSKPNRRFDGDNEKTFGGCHAGLDAELAIADSQNN